MTPDIFPWQQADWRHLQAYQLQQRIPQALLLSGPTGIGKRRLAETYAKLLLCRTPQQLQACGSCPACLLAQGGTHPDYLVLEPEETGKIIGIDKIRQLIVKLALKPQYAGYRPVIIQPADRLNNAAANAFLKCLEEPPERTCFILLSDQPGKLPATVRSRCQKMQCEQPDQALAATWLIEQGISADVQPLLQMAQGAPLLAQAYAKQGFIQLRRDTFNHYLQIARGKTNLLTVADQWQKYDTATLNLILSWLCSWLADLVKLAHGVSTIANPDFSEDLQILAARVDVKALYHYYDTLLRSKSLLPTQLNKQLQTEKLLIDWRQLHSH